MSSDKNTSRKSKSLKPVQLLIIYLTAILSRFGNFIMNYLYDKTSLKYFCYQFIDLLVVENEKKKLEFYLFH
jgi:hypothetical protein